MGHVQTPATFGSRERGRRCRRRRDGPVSRLGRREPGRDHGRVAQILLPVLQGPHRGGTLSSLLFESHSWAVEHGYVGAIPSIEESGYVELLTFGPDLATEELQRATELYPK